MSRVYQRNGAWCIDYSFNGQRTRKKIGPDKRLAELALKKVEIEIVENRYLDIKKEQKVRFDDFADKYLRIHSQVNNKSWRKSDLVSIKMLKRYFSGKYLHEITTLMVENFKSRRQKEVSPATTNRQLACLKSMFNKAIAWGDYDAANPVTVVKMLKEDNQRLRFLEQDEIAALLRHCTNDLKPLVEVAVNTGMRFSEITGLKWRDIDVKRGILHLYDTKSGKKREIPMNRNVEAVLFRIRKNPNSEYVFCRKDGKKIIDIRKTFWTALRKSDIKGFVFHDLRHTFASQLVMKGVDLNTVRELLGHSTIQMTLRYSHLSPAHKKQAVDILNGRFDTGLTPERKAPLGTDRLESVTV